MIRYLVTLTVALLMSGCAASLPARGAAPISPGQTSPGQASDAQGAYLLGVGDSIAITVYGEAGLSGQQAVGPDGSITMPLIGRVEASGRTADQLSADITARLADGYLRQPSVSIAIVTYRPYFILGEVNKPGEYPYAKGLTVIAAIAKAEGFTYRARKNKVFLKREGSPAETEMPLAPTLEVRPGDTIRVGERYF